MTERAFREHLAASKSCHREADRSFISSLLRVTVYILYNVWNVDPSSKNSNRYGRPLLAEERREQRSQSKQQQLRVPSNVTVGRWVSVGSVVTVISTML